MSTHVVQRGDQLDSFWAISKHYCVSYAELKKLNPDLMNRYPPDDAKHGYLYPGDVVKLPPPRPPNMQAHNAVSACPSARKKLKVLKIVGPVPAWVCEPLTLTVVQYDGDPTEDDKKRVKWFVRDVVTGEDVGQIGYP